MKETINTDENLGEATNKKGNQSKYWEKLRNNSLIFKKKNFGNDKEFRKISMKRQRPNQKLA